MPKLTPWKIPCFESTLHTQKTGKITENKVKESLYVCMTKPNKFEHLIKLLRFSYLSIKSLKFGTLKDTMIGVIYLG